MFPLRQLPDGSLQVAEQLGQRAVVVAMKRRQLVDDIVPTLDAGMAEDLAARDHLEGDAAEAQAHPDVRVAWILPLAGPLRGQVLEVVIAKDEVVGDAKDGRAE